MNVPHLTIYFDPDMGYVVDEDLPDNTDGTRNPNGTGLRFASAKRAGKHAAYWLHQMAVKMVDGRHVNDVATAEEGRRIRAANEDFYRDNQ